MIEDIANITTIIANIIVFISAAFAVRKWVKQRKKKKPLNRQRRRKHKR